MLYPTFHVQLRQDLVKAEVVHAVMHPGFKREDLLRLLHFTGESVSTSHALRVRSWWVQAGVTGELSLLCRGAGPSACGEGWGDACVARGGGGVFCATISLCCILSPFNNKVRTVAQQTCLLALMHTHTRTRAHTHTRTHTHTHTHTHTQCTYDTALTVFIHTALLCPVPSLLSNVNLHPYLQRTSHVTQCHCHPG